MDKRLLKSSGSNVVGAEDATLLNAPARALSVPSSGCVRILQVDQNRGAAILLHKALMHLRVPHRITLANTGADALRLLTRRARHTHLPNLILLDVNLPRVGGCDFLQAVKADVDLAQVPVVVFTSGADRRDIPALYDLKASAFVPKPNEIGGFLRLAAVILEFWLIRMRLHSNAAHIRLAWHRSAPGGSR